MKQRFWLIVIALGVIMLIAVGALASQGSHNSTKAAEGKISVTVMNNIGVKEIEVQNLNTGKTYTSTLLSLPMHFNCTEGDYLQFRVVTHEGYRWNAWWFLPMDTWNNDNPAIIQASGTVISNDQLTMRPDCIIIGQAPATSEPYGGE